MQFSWKPYDYVLQRVSVIPEELSEHISFGTENSPLINFFVVEQYYPDHVMRQFRCKQTASFTKVFENYDETLRKSRIHHPQRLAKYDETYKVWVDLWEEALRKPERSDWEPICKSDDYDKPADEYVQWFERNGFTRFTLEDVVPETRTVVNTKRRRSGPSRRKRVIYKLLGGFNTGESIK